MDTLELIKKVRKLEIKTKGISTQVFSGEYHSAFKGRGMSFSEVRNYQYGDEVKAIDWNVTARTGIPHVKVFEEERELTVMLIADGSNSVFFGSGSQLKNEFVAELCAVLAFAANQNNDKVGLILFSEEVDLYIPPKKGRKHILRIIRELINHKPASKGTDIGNALKFFNNVIHKRSICFLLSDFLAKPFDTSLAISAKRHDLIGVQLIDPLEKELPKLPLVRVRDSETGSIRLLDLSNKRVRDQLENNFQEKREKVKTTFFKSGADLIELNTDQPYHNKLFSFFKRRSSHK